MKKIRNIFWVVSYTILSSLRILKHYLYVNKLYKQLTDHLHYPKEIFRSKMYSTVVPFILSFPYSKLTGCKLSNESYDLLVLISGIMPIHDYLIDKNLVDNNSISDILKSPNREANVELFRQLYFEIDKISDPQIRELLNTIHNAQIESLNQKSNVLDMQTLEKILREKSGWTGILFGYIVNQDTINKHHKLLFEVGYWVQLFDDMMDYSKDIKEGIRTFANIETNNQYQLRIHNQRMIVVNLLNKLKFSQQKIRDFLFSIFYFEKLSTTYYLRFMNRREYPKSGLGELWNFLTSLRFVFSDLVKFDLDSK